MGGERRRKVSMLAPQSSMTGLDASIETAAVIRPLFDTRRGVIAGEFGWRCLLLSVVQRWRERIAATAYDANHGHYRKLRSRLAVVQGPAGDTRLVSLARP